MTDISQTQLGLMIVKLEEALAKATTKYGSKSYHSGHEIVGALTEEFDEFKQAVHHFKHTLGKQNPEATDMACEKAVNELLDIAVNAVFGACSLRMIASERT